MRYAPVLKEKLPPLIRIFPSLNRASTVAPAPELDATQASNPLSKIPFDSSRAALRRGDPSTVSKAPPNKILLSGCTTTVFTALSIHRFKSKPLSGVPFVLSRARLDGATAVLE